MSNELLARRFPGRVAAHFSSVGCDGFPDVAPPGHELGPLSVVNQQAELDLRNPFWQDEDGVELTEEVINPAENELASYRFYVDNAA